MDCTQRLILTAVASVSLTVGALWYYGYVHFAKPEDARLLGEFTLLKSIPGEEVRLNYAAAEQSALCIDGVLVLFDNRQKGLSGVLLDSKKRAVRCVGETVPQNLKP